MPSPPAFHWQTVDEGLLKDIYESDQAMYPAPQLTYGRLKSWVDASPELCLYLQRSQSESNTHPKTSESDGVHGLIIVLPLRQPYWDRLRQGVIEEHDVDAIEMFPPPLCRGPRAHSEDSRAKVGLHVFHIERFPSFASVWKDVKFTALALDEIRDRVTEAFKSWEVMGYSALTATKQGNAAFKSLGFVLSDSASGSGPLHQSAEMVERRGNGTFSVHPSRLIGDIIEEKA